MQFSWPSLINIRNCKKTSILFLTFCVILCLMLCAFFLLSCNTHPKSTRQLGVAIAGTESYISAVLQPYVEHFSSKPSDWQSFLRFLVIPLGKLMQLPFKPFRICRLRNSRVFFLKVSTKTAKCGKRKKTVFLASLPSLAHCFQPRSTPFV